VIECAPPAARCAAEWQDRLRRAANGLELDRYHRYWLRDGSAGPEDVTTTELYGVTSIIGCLDKSGPLSSWAARVQYETDELAAYRLYENGLPDGLALAHFQTLFRIETGGPGAFRAHRDAAADLGEALHALVEHRVKQMLGLDEPHPEASDEALQLFTVWERWAREVRLEPYAVEFPVLDREQRVAGTVDLLGRVDGRVAQVDWKTGADIYAAAHLQSAAYRWLMRRMGVTDTLVPGVIVRLPKQEGEGVHAVWTDPARDEELIEVFLALCRVYPWKREEDRKSLAQWKARRAVAR